MPWYHVMLIGAAIIAGLVANKTPRAWLWVCSLLGSGVVSYAYLRLADAPVWAPAPGIAMMSDAAVFLLIREFAKERWELYGLGTIMMVSVTMNLIQTSAIIAGFPARLPDDIYAYGLEAFNYAALLLILGRGVVDRVERHDGLFVSRHLGRTVDRLGAVAKAKTHQKTPFRTW
jgi:hypothetical protein